MREARDSLRNPCVKGQGAYAPICVEVFIIRSEGASLYNDGEWLWSPDDLIKQMKLVVFRLPI